MESCRRMSKQGNKAMSHRLRRYVSVECKRRLMKSGKWYLATVSYIDKRL